MKKCESCKHFDSLDGHCHAWPVRNVAGEFVSVNLDRAREICNKEGDGIFVYFEPKQPQSGATFGQLAMAMVASSTV